MIGGVQGESSAPPGDRRQQVLESALDTFARQGYRATSMEDLARRARISRPGLYLYFSSKQELLRAACEHALSRDATAVESLLEEGDAPLPERLFAALDLWSGQYVGPLAADLDRLLEQDGDLLGDLPRLYSERFATALGEALQRSNHGQPIADTVPRAQADLTRDVLLALVVGLKHRAATRAEFRSGLAHGLALMFSTTPPSS